MKKRLASVKRKTKETDITVNLTIGGSGRSNIDTGIGILDHMLELFSFHGLFDLDLKAKGDLKIDIHHTNEDIGIVLGDAFKKALGDKKGIRRYGDILLPMDEALMLAAVDCSGRPYFVWEVALPQPKVGTWDSELAEDFFRALAVHGGLTLHLRLLSGVNTHHIVEAAFKACARALRAAIAPDPRETGVPSTKGTLT